MPWVKKALYDVLVDMFKAISQLNHNQELLLIRSKTIMSDLTDLKDKFDAAVGVTKQAFTDVGTRLDANTQTIKDLQDKINAGGTVDATELQALKDDISGSSQALTDGAAALEGKLNPAPPATT